MKIINSDVEDHKLTGTTGGCLFADNRIYAHFDEKVTQKITYMKVLTL